MDHPYPPNSSTSATPSSHNAQTDESSPKYVPQFSAATEMILKRITGGSGGALGMGPIGNTALFPNYEDMRNKVMSEMKKVELPAMPQITGRRNQGGRASVGSASSAGAIAPKPAGTPEGSTQKNGTSTKGGKRAGAGRPKAGTKRKRAAKESSEEPSSESSAMSDLGDDSEDDDAASITEDFPKVTSSGRAVNKPAQFIPAVSDTPPKKRGPSKKSVENALCKRCGRGHSPASNMIVFCDGCNLGWHQMCHDPSISDEAVKDESAAWFCADCTEKRERKRGAKTVPAPSPAAPSPVVLAESPKLVSWEGRSDAEKRAYFSSLPYQLLVDLLIQATTLQPNLPVFPPVQFAGPPMQAYLPTQSLQTSRPSAANTAITVNSRAAANFHGHPPVPFPPSVAAASGLFARAEAHPNATINFIRKITPSSNASSPTTMQPPPFAKTSSAPPTLPPQPGQTALGLEGAGDSRESTPASPPYPKPGNGLMAKLGPDDQDMEWLEDANDFEAFSHVLYDQNGVGGQPQ
ncbi:PHD finger domain-containing phf1, partial [Hyphodiscus hymeniophilus]